MIVTGLSGLFFYFAAALLLLSAAMVISVRNPIHSILFLIFCFFNAAILFLLAGAEFLAMILIMIYVGAVAILFLFVVMMINLDHQRMRANFSRYYLLGGSLAAIVFLELAFVFFNYQAPTVSAYFAEPIANFENVTNATALGNVLYTNYFFYFELVSLILLVAMIAAIALVMQHRIVKRQSVYKQVSRTVDDSIDIKSVASGKGLEE